MDLVEVDGVDPEAFEAALHLAKQRVSPKALDRGSPRPLGLPALREHVWARFEAGHGAPHDLFRVPEAVLRRRVDPVHPELERVVDRRDRVLVVLRSPAPVVATAPDRPGSEADAGDLEAGGSEQCRPERGGCHDDSFQTHVPAR